MARKNIGIPLDRVNRNNHNDNYKELYGVVNNLVDTITDEVYEQIIDGAKLNWKSPVDSENDLPTSANEGDTVMTRDDGKVYRYDGSQWQEIQQIDAGPVNELDSRLSSQLADTGKKVFLNSAVVHKGQPNGMITFIDDDGQEGFYTKLAPIARDKNVKMTSALITSRIGNDRYMTWDQIKELRDDESGLFEFVSHSHDAHTNSNRPTNWDEADYRSDLEQVKTILKENGLNDMVHVLPFGDTSKRNRRIEREYFEASFHIGSIGEPVSSPLNQYKIGRINIEEETSYIKKQMDAAAQDNEWVVIECHIDQYDVTTEKVEELIDYALSKDLKFVNTKEGLNHYGNLLQTDDGNVTVGADGKFYGSLVAGKDEEDYEPNAPITDFPVNTFINLKVRWNDRTEYGLQDTGSILVYHDEEVEDFSYQLFTCTRPRDEGNGYQLIRYWTGDGYTNWRSLSGIGTDRERYQYSENNSIYDFPKNRFTHIKVRNSDKEVYGVDDPGMIVAYRDDEVIYSYQIFQPAQKYYRLFRYWRNFDEEERWGSWQKEETFPKRKEYTTIFSAQDIPAHTCLSTNLEVDTDDFKKFSPFPKKEAPGGLVWMSFKVSDGKVRTRLCNVTNDVITIEELPFGVIFEE